MTFPGKLVTLEGIEGAGKSSVIQCLKSDCEQYNKTVVTREPGGTKIAEKIRQLVLAPSDEQLDAISETLLIWAARRQHWLHVIKPALEAGNWVICDRFIDSSYAYQHCGRGVESDFLRALQIATVGGYQADITLLFVIEPGKGLARMVRSGKTLDRIEQQQQDFFEKVDDGYRQLARNNPERITTIDAHNEHASVVAAAREVLRKKLIQPFNKGK